MEQPHPDDQWQPTAGLAIDAQHVVVSCEGDVCWDSTALLRVQWPIAAPSACFCNLTCLLAIILVEILIGTQLPHCMVHALVLVLPDSCLPHMTNVLHATFTPSTLFVPYVSAPYYFLIPIFPSCTFHLFVQCMFAMHALCLMQMHTYQLTLLTIEDDSNLAFHIEQAWIHAHLRLAMAQSGLPGASMALSVCFPLDSTFSP